MRKKEIKLLSSSSVPLLNTSILHLREYCHQHFERGLWMLLLVGIVVTVLAALWSFRQAL